MIFKTIHSIDRGLNSPAFAKKNQIKWETSNSIIPTLSEGDGVIFAYFYLSVCREIFIFKNTFSATVFTMLFFRQRRKSKRKRKEKNKTTRKERKQIRIHRFLSISIGSHVHEAKSNSLLQKQVLWSG